MIEVDGERREISGFEAQTTNNRMELTAAIRALEALERSSRVRVFTDSEYLRNGITASTTRGSTYIRMSPTVPSGNSPRD